MTTETEIEIEVADKEEADRITELLSEGMLFSDAQDAVLATQGVALEELVLIDPADLDPNIRELVLAVEPRRKLDPVEPEAIASKPSGSVTKHQRGSHLPLVGRLINRVRDTGTFFKYSPIYIAMLFDMRYQFHMFSQDFRDNAHTLMTNNFANAFMGLFPKRAVEMDPEGKAENRLNFVHKEPEFLPGTKIKNPRAGKPYYDMKARLDSLGKAIEEATDVSANETGSFSAALTEATQAGGKLRQIEADLQKIIALENQKAEATDVVERLKRARVDSIAQAQSHLRIIGRSVTNQAIKDAFAETKAQLEALAIDETIPEDDRPGEAADCLVKLERKLSGEVNSLTAKTVQLRGKTEKVLGILNDDLGQKADAATAKTQKLTEANERLEIDLARYRNRRWGILNDPFVEDSENPGTYARKNILTGGSDSAILAIHDIDPYMQVIEDLSEDIKAGLGESGKSTLAAKDELQACITTEKKLITEHTTAEELLTKVRTVMQAIDEKNASLANTDISLDEDLIEQHADAMDALNQAEKIGLKYTEVRKNVGDSLFNNGGWSAKFQFRVRTGRVERNATPAEQKRLQELIETGAIVIPSFNKPGGRKLGYYSGGDTMYTRNMNDDGGKPQEGLRIIGAYAGENGRQCGQDPAKEADIKAGATKAYLTNSRTLLAWDSLPASDNPDADRRQFNWWISFITLGSLSYNSGPVDRGRGFSIDIVDAIINDAKNYEQGSNPGNNPWDDEIIPMVNFYQKMLYDFGNNVIRNEWKRIQDYMRERWFGGFKNAEKNQPNNPREYGIYHHYKYKIWPATKLWFAHEIPNRLLEKILTPINKIRHYFKKWDIKSKLKSRSDKLKGTKIGGKVVKFGKITVLAPGALILTGMVVGAIGNTIELVTKSNSRIDGVGEFISRGAATIPLGVFGAGNTLVQLVSGGNAPDAGIYLTPPIANSDYKYLRADPWWPSSAEPQQTAAPGSGAAAGPSASPTPGTGTAPTQEQQNEAKKSLQEAFGDPSEQIQSGPPPSATPSKSAPAAPAATPQQAPKKSMEQDMDDLLKEFDKKNPPGNDNKNKNKNSNSNKSTSSNRGQRGLNGAAQRFSEVATTKTIMLKMKGDWYRVTGGNAERVDNLRHNDHS